VPPPKRRALCDVSGGLPKLPTRCHPERQQRERSERCQSRDRRTIASSRTHTGILQNQPPSAARKQSRAPGAKITQVTRDILTNAAAQLDLPSLRRYREASAQTKGKLDTALTAAIPNYATEDANFVVFGSQARGEWTSKSDLDWTYLIDGEVNADHREALKALRASDSRTDSTFNRVRKIGEAFQHSLDHIFFENKQIAPLTRKYGVF